MKVDRVRDKDGLLSLSIYLYIYIGICFLSQKGPIDLYIYIDAVVIFSFQDPVVQADLKLWPFKVGVAKHC